MKVTLKLANGKYEFVFEESSGDFQCLRHGESWRNLNGDKAVFLLFMHAKELEEKLNEQAQSGEKNKETNR